MQDGGVIGGRARPRVMRGLKRRKLSGTGRYTAHMRVYKVGGAVRDALMGLESHDHDWVVVGATPEQMTALGYTPVGLDFPVFLHPETHEEHALARTERKTGRGYAGFTVFASPDVTLEEDLARRDLTINAMAQDEHGAIIDPHGGRADLASKLLRHVSGAFVEDPVRVLRIARFAARWPDFQVAPETHMLMVQMVREGEVDHLVAERIWQEFAKGLMERQPSRMFEVLRACGALARIFPELDRLWGVPQRADYHPEVDTGVHVMMVLDMAARLKASLPVRWACLCHDLGKGTTPADVLPRHIGHEMRSVKLLLPVCERFRVPVACKELAEVVAREHANIHRCESLRAAALLRLIERCDGLRKPDRLDEILLACECDARGRGGLAEQAYPQRPHVISALRAAQSVITADVAAQAAARGVRGPGVGRLIHEARARAMAEAMRLEHGLDGDLG